MVTTVTAQFSFCTVKDRESQQKVTVKRYHQALSCVPILWRNAGLGGARGKGGCNDTQIKLTKEVQWTKVGFLLAMLIGVDYKLKT